LLARATDIMVLFFTHIPFVVNHTINATPPERLQHYLFIFHLRKSCCFSLKSHAEWISFIYENLKHV